MAFKLENKYKIVCFADCILYVENPRFHTQKTFNTYFKNLANLPDNKIYTQI